MPAPKARISLKGAAPLLLVGAGKMGGAMLDGWVRRGLDPAAVTIVDPHMDGESAAEVRAKGMTVVPVGTDVSAGDFRTLVIAVKPQMIEEVLPQIWRLAVTETVVISVVAGTRLERFERAFEAGQPIVRAMPNTPAQIGMGMTVAVGNGSLSADQRGVVDALLRSVGEVAWVAEEPLMDAVTAVSGSGPAYVFLLAECLAQAAVAAGLPPELAAKLARQTVAGGGGLLAASPLPPDELRRNVTSPKGTTAAALDVLMGEGGLQQLMTQAVEAARRRSLELG